MICKLKYILTTILVLNIIIYAKTDVEAGNAYVEALREILDVTPSGKIEAIEEKGPDVAFSMKDTKFLNLTLKDSIIMALQNNYDIRIAKIDPLIKEKDITVEKSEFDPTLTVTGDVEDSETPSNSQLQLGTGATAGDFRVDTNALNAIIEKKVETGATLTMEYNIEKAFLDPPPFAIFNPSAEAYIEAKITQPLLKSAGIFYNRSDIYIARNDKKRSVLELKETAIEVTNSTQTAYWELVKAIEELRVS